MPLKPPSGSPALCSSLGKGVLNTFLEETPCHVETCLAGTPLWRAVPPVLQQGNLAADGGIEILHVEQHVPDVAGVPVEVEDTLFFNNF